MKQKKKTCFLCAAVLALSTIPVAAFAEEEESTAYKTSIFVATDRHDAEGYNLLEPVLSQIVADKDAVLPAYAVLGGDTVGSGPASQESGHPAYTVSEADEEFYEVLGNDIETFYTFGSHDTGNTNGYGEYLSGPAQCDEYYLYGISYQQMLYDTEEQIPEDYTYLDLDDPNGLGAQAASENFLNWVETLEDHKPILVMSHVPMHAHRDDNLGAATWVEALNKASESHDIFAFFGHNHSEEKNGSLVDRPYYFVLPGSSMPVQGADVSSKEETTINFYYMNAGYLIMGYGSLVTFTDEEADGVYDAVTIQRYNTIRKDVCFGDTGIVTPYTVELRQW